MSHILLLEDEPELQRVFAKHLQTAGGYEVSACSTLREARELIAGRNFDLFIFDVTLPDGNSFTLCEELKKQNIYQAVPVVFLTGRIDIDDKELGFSLGADDYITKPVSIRELRARVDARLRKAEIAHVLIKGNLKINSRLQEAFLLEGGQEKALDLTPIEFRILALLASTESRTFTRQQLFEAVWRGKVHVVDRVIDTHVSNLRKKLRPTSYTVKSSYGEGYVLTSVSTAKVA